MLKDDFYTIDKIDKLSENEYDAFIQLNRNHSIFEGHFPGKPIVPGVCMLQIVKEIVSSLVNKNISLKVSKNIKFTALIDPTINSYLRLNLLIDELEGGEIKVKNTSYFGTTDAVKMDLNYVIE
ncbi:MAG: 3-hydroxyacyl-ACP dehydratase [Brumimicrobium sp.]|nr:3-hydroxyacyl-ACP dehydratase [Brumimicrobium sp.]